MIDNHFMHEYYDLEIRKDHNHTYGFIDISNDPDAIYCEDASDADDSPPYCEVDLNITFEFYGHTEPKIYIDSNGFISTYPYFCDRDGAPVFCNWQYPTKSIYKRYIAPLMTDFNPGKFNETKIHYKYLYHESDTSLNSIIIQWTNMTLYCAECDFNIQDDSFTFQARLYSNGNIIFNYLSSPHDIRSLILDDEANSTYPLIIGIEDATIYTFNNHQVLVPYIPLNVTQNYTYHINTENEKIGNSILFIAKENCRDQLNCTSCTEFTKANEHLANYLECGWCPDLNLCTDRFAREYESLTENCQDKDYLIPDTQWCNNQSYYYDHITSWQPATKDDTSSVFDNTTAQVVASFILIAVSALIVAYIVAKLKENRHAGKYEGSDTVNNAFEVAAFESLQGTEIDDNYKIEIDDDSFDNDHHMNNDDVELQQFDNTIEDDNSLVEDSNSEDDNNQM